MDKLVEDNLNILNNNGVSTFATNTVLNSDNFYSSIGEPTTSNPGDFKIHVDWSQFAIPGVPDKTLITTTMYFYHRNEWTGSVKANNETFINIDGSIKFLNLDEDVTGARGYYHVMVHTLEVPSSTISIQISGRCDVGESNYNGTIWNGVEGRGNFYLNSPIDSLFPPTDVFISGKYEVGEQVSISWPAGTGPIEYYNVEYNAFTAEDGWLGWSSVGKTETLNKIHSITSIKAEKIKYRVRARNSTSASSWKESADYIYHYGIKVNNNGFSYGTLNVWNGTKWSPGRIKVWDGTKWVFTFTN